MPNLKASIKDLRKTKRKTVYNSRLKTRIKKGVKSFNEALATNVDKAGEVLVHLNKVFDKAAKKNVIKKQAASRHISRLSKKLNKTKTANNDKDTRKGA